MELPEELASRPARKAGQQPTSTLTLDASVATRVTLKWEEPVTIDLSLSRVQVK